MMVRKKRQKPLLASLKERKRYVVYEVITDSKINLSKTNSALKRHFLGYVGQLGAAKAGMIFLKDWKNNKGIIRINNKCVDYLKSSFVSFKEVDSKKVIVRSLGVSGTLKQARIKYMEVDL